MDVADRREDRGAARGEEAAGGAAVAGVGASAEGAEADGGTVGAAAVAAEGAAASAGCCTCGIDVTAPVRLRREPPALFSREQLLVGQRGERRAVVAEVRRASAVLGART